MEFTGFVDESYNRYGIERVGNVPKLTNLPYEYMVSRGITGIKPIKVSGANGIVGTSYETVGSEGGLLTYLATAQTLKVVSSDVADAGTLLSSGTCTDGSTTLVIEDTGADFVGDGVAAGDVVLIEPPTTGFRTDYNRYGVVSDVTATQLTLYRALDTIPTGLTYRVVNNSGTGAGVVVLDGLDSDYNPIFEYVVTNGTTAVATTKEFIRVIFAKCISVGTTGANKGAVSIKNNAASATHLIIPAAFPTSLTAAYTVPANKTLYISSVFYDESINVRVLLDLYKRQYKESVFIPQGAYARLRLSAIQLYLKVPIRVPEKCDVEVRALGAGGGNALVSATFMGWLE